MLGSRCWFQVRTENQNREPRTEHRAPRTENKHGEPRTENGEPRSYAMGFSLRIIHDVPKRSRSIEKRCA